MSKILIVDDDAQLRQSFERLLVEEGHEVRTAVSGEAGLAAVQEEMPDLVIMDVRMPGMSGIETLARMQAVDPKLPVIIMTAFGTTETAIEAVNKGAFEYVLKPFEIPDVLKTIGQALEAGRFMRSKVELDVHRSNPAAEALVGQSRAMQEIYKAVGRVAATGATVLIRGESGTGKELVARAIYTYSHRSEKPFLVINCVAIPETLLESELFGYEKGAFSGAYTRRVGKIEQANGGTVFLDEIGDMPISIQAKILRLLQEKSIERLGGRATIPVDVRIITATNRNLEQAVAEGRFREDLYYRLKVVTIELPPLRQRKEDLEPLAEYFLSRFSREMRIENPGLAADGLRALHNHSWPGNVRELANILQKAIIFSRGCPIGEDGVAHAIGGEPKSEPRSPEATEDALREWVRLKLENLEPEHGFNGLSDEFSRVVISETLRLTGGNRSQAARLLGLSRPTLLSKIEKLGLTVETTVKFS